MNYLRSVLIIPVLLIINGCTLNEKLWTIKFEGDSFEHKWAVQDLNPELPSDWSDSGFLTFEYKSSSTQRFYINLYDTGGLRRLRILPFQGAWIRASVPIANFMKINGVGHDMAAIGQKGMPGYGLGFTSMVGTLRKVDSLGILMENPIASPTLELRNFKLTMNPEDSVLSPVPLVDEFGQWIPDTWTGKANTTEDLMSAWEEEAESLQTDRFSVSRYGGFLQTKAGATGSARNGSK